LFPGGVLPSDGGHRRRGDRGLADASGSPDRVDLTSSEVEFSTEPLIGAPRTVSFSYSRRRFVV